MSDRWVTLIDRGLVTLKPHTSATNLLDGKVYILDEHRKPISCSPPFSLVPFVKDALTRSVTLNQLKLRLYGVGGVLDFESLLSQHDYTPSHRLVGGLPYKVQAVSDWYPSYEEALLAVFEQLL